MTPKSAISSAIGGENVTTIIDGRARYPVNVAFPRFCASIEDLSGASAFR